MIFPQFFFLRTHHRIYIFVFLDIKKVFFIFTVSPYHFMIHDGLVLGFLKFYLLRWYFSLIYFLIFPRYPASFSRDDVDLRSFLRTSPVPPLGANKYPDGACFTRRQQRPYSQIPPCTYPISHNAPFRTEMCTFLFWMVYCEIWDRCIVGFVRLVCCLCFNYCATRMLILFSFFFFFKIYTDQFVLWKFIPWLLGKNLDNCKIKALFFITQVPFNLLIYNVF